MAKAKFKRDTVSETPGMATTSLPDIVFMLLFFFMVTTNMRKSEVMVQQRLPYAVEVKKLENVALVSYINIGSPLQVHQRLYGTATRVQLNDAFREIDEIQEFIASEREKRSEQDQRLMTTALKIDEEVRMGTVTDVKQALRRCGALKIAYMTKKGERMFQ
jgi:biopolymer transport protein ExbD